MKKIEIPEIIDSCLNKIQSGEASLAECLVAYPDHAAFLEPILSTAIEIRSTLSPMGPRQAYAETTKIRILNWIQSVQPKLNETKSSRRLRLFHSLSPRFALLSLALAAALIFSGLGVSSASAQALPGDMLFSIKRGVEEIRLLLSTTVSGDADLLTQFTQERLDELEQLVASDRTVDIEQAIEEYRTLLSRLLVVAEEAEIQEDPDTLDKIHGGITHHEEVLQRILEKAPPAAQKGLENALERSNHGKSVIEYIQQGGNPKDLAPGQQKKETNGEEQEKPGSGKDKPHPKDKTPGPKPKETSPDT